MAKPIQGVNPWNLVKNKLKTEGAQNVSYDSDLDGLIDQIRTITRADLEYPTENVTFAYLAAINKLKDITKIAIPNAIAFVTLDGFTDKDILTALHGYGGGLILMRWTDENNYYDVVHRAVETTADHKLRSVVAGTITDLATEAVDLNYSDYYRSGVSGSTLKSDRGVDGVVELNATDTNFMSGSFGLAQYSGTYDNTSLAYLPAKLMPPATKLKPSVRIFEVDVIGTGKTNEDPIRPNFLKKLTPEGDKDLLSITWGAFDYKGEPTMLVVVTGDNPYQRGAILEQESYVKSKNLKVYKPPRDLLEARQLHRQIKQERPEIIAGAHNLAYQCIGHEELEYLAAADFYDGFTQGIYDIKHLKNVPDWELRRTIARWKDRLKRVKIAKLDAERHMKKLEEFERVGW